MLLLLDELRKSMQEIDDEHGDDAEVWHPLADQLLVKILQAHGYHEVTNWWKSGPRWYA